MSKKFVFVLALPLLGLAGCDDDSSDSGSSAQGGPISGLSSIVGVYDNSYVEDDGTIDEAYTHINDSGTVFYYDYLGDSYTNGPNCYERFEDGTLEHVDGNRFMLEAGYFGEDAVEVTFNFKDDFADYDGEVLVFEKDDEEDTFYMIGEISNKQASDFDAILCTEQQIEDWLDD